MKYYFYALIVFILDQVSKWFIVKRIPLGEERPVLGDFFILTSHRNRGAAFGILQNQRWFFIVITLIVVIGILWYMRRTIRERKVLLSFALSLLLGGAIGNFIDRALFGEVVDFLQFTFDFSLFGKAIYYIYPIFNLADSAIVIGVILIFLESLLTWRKEKKGATNEHKSDLI
ncbi:MULTISPECIES: signal peptidase II [Paenibacillus]|uniref:Lipoprotein signal peptidase n=1 Tax=Paenibacillus germinis TaxID=2654979 RepID=A0ABX1YX18_9BACL|nr:MULTISPECIES: signal peptidase II [Paenibacillus]KQX64708.1 signal peptidase II [Paenibacillus sp. Root444D2]KRE51961.1 signal peptidase II [Paenibacillus sp. Soil724D2]NOU85109.1 lipoprotein signal peptidase [Paenibacillus germinis]